MLQETNAIIVKENKRFSCRSYSLSKTLTKNRNTL